MGYKVTLRDLTDNDATTLAAIANNKKIWLQLRDRFPHPYKLDDAKWYINYAQTNDKEIIKAIVADDVLCGVIGAIIMKMSMRMLAKLDIG